MGLIKNRNCLDLPEAEDIKKRCQEYTEELYKKDFNDPDNHNGDLSLRARHSGVWSQVDVRKHIKLVEVMELQLSYLKS